MTLPWSIRIVANLEAPRTEAHVLFPELLDEPYSVLFETESGLAADTLWDVPDVVLDNAHAAMDAAATALERYPNRRGQDPPRPIDAAGLASWLLERREPLAAC